MSVCIRRQDGYCCVQYQACPGVLNAMSLDYKSTILDAGDIDTLCSNDYVNIPGEVARELMPDIPSLS